jgi:hypothetical protein
MQSTISDFSFIFQTKRTPRASSSDPKTSKFSDKRSSSCSSLLKKEQRRGVNGAVDKGVRRPPPPRCQVDEEEADHSRLPPTAERRKSSAHFRNS